MTIEEIDSILSAVLSPRSIPLAPPSPGDWGYLEEKMTCRFSDDFKTFYEALSRYRFPGDILAVSAIDRGDVDTIDFVHSMEMDLGNWDVDMVPFYSIGNGDYFCISRKTSPDSAVYYRYHDKNTFELASPNIESWISSIPSFLAGE